MKTFAVCLLIALPFVAEAGDRTPAVVMPKPFVMTPLNLPSLSGWPAINAAPRDRFRPRDNAPGAAIARAVAGESAGGMVSQMPIIRPSATVDRGIVGMRPRSSEKFDLLVATPKVEDWNIHRLSPAWQPRNPRARSAHHPGWRGGTLNKPQDRMPGSNAPEENGGR